jgi:hypothetical protein
MSESIPMSFASVNPSFVAEPAAVVSPYPHAVHVTETQGLLAHVRKVAEQIPEPTRSAFLRAIGMFGRAEAKP